MSVLTLALMACGGASTRTPRHVGKSRSSRAGDIDTMTVKEYLKLSKLRKLHYKLYRQPLFLFGLGVPAYFVIIQRLPVASFATAERRLEKCSRVEYRARRFLYAALLFLRHRQRAVGWTAGSASRLGHRRLAVLLQHQFEETTWDKAERWDFRSRRCLAPPITIFRRF